MTSTTLPLPSSPHWVPTTTMLGMTCSRAEQVRKEPLGRREHLADGERSLRSILKIHRQQLVGGGSGTADHQRAAHALGARVGERFLESTADDVAGDRRAAVAQPPGQREGGRLLAREVDDEEVG